MKANLAQRRGLRLASAFLLVVLVLAALLLATPQGRAWAQEVLQFFSRAGSDTLPVQTWQLTPVPTPGTPTPDLSSILDAHLNVSEVEAQAGFDVLEPAWLPDSLTFVGATYESEKHIARIFYRYVETNGLVVEQEPFQGIEDCELCSLVGASAVVESVKIGVTTGEYVEGVWNLTEKGPVWVPDPYLKRLRWQANGIAFEILFMGPPEAVTKEDLVAIARSLK